ALIGHSRQARWTVGSLVELMVALGEADGLQPVMAVLEAGLLYPELIPLSSDEAELRSRARLKKFEQWLGASNGSRQPAVFAHPAASARAIGTNLGLPACPGAVALATGKAAHAAQEADGLDWPLRLAVVWQLVAGAPLRRTQQGDFFKRDLDRLR